MQRNISSNLVEEEIEKSIQKINNLFKYGMQQSSSVFIPEGEVCNVSFQTSFEPFHVHEKAKEAEQTFCEVFESIIEQRQLPQYLYKILQEQKHETALILEQYDLIISELSKSLIEYDKEYRQKCEKHSLRHQLLEENIENLISEINRIGKEEIQNIRMSIIQNTKNKTEKYWKKCQKLLDESAADVPFDDYIWKPPTSMLSFQELVDAFSQPQEEVVTKRRNMLSKICELRKNLEKEKLDHALRLEKLEKELFEVKENYKRKKLYFAKLKRKQNRLISRKEELAKELKDVMKSIEKECEAQKKVSEKHKENRKIKNYLLQENSQKYDCILKDRYMEAYNLLADTMNTMKFIMENILGIVQNPFDMEGFDFNNKNILSYICRESYWLDFINAAPKNSHIDDIIKVIENYWFYLKVNSDLVNKKRTLCLENKELLNFLKYYYSFQESH